MKYLCLVYAEEEEITALPDGNMQALIAENVDLCEELRRSGHFVSAAPLDSVKTAVTVRVRNGKASTTDGPFAETREQLGGYYLIEARDLDEAVRVAQRIPGARLGSVEVRRIPVHDPREPWERHLYPALVLRAATGTPATGTGTVPSSSPGGSGSCRGAPV